MNKLLLALLLSSGLTLAHLPASAHGDSSTGVSNASGFSALGSILVVGGSIQSAGASGAVIVESIQSVGDSTVVVLKGVSDGARATLRLSGQAAGNFSVGVGKIVTATAMASGYVLSVAGQIIAFVPNEIGKSLLHHSRTGATSCGAC